MNKPQNMFYRALRQNVQWLCVWVGHKLSLSLWQRTFAQNVRWKSFLSGYFFQKISQHLNPKNEFLFQRPKKNVSDYDEVWYKRMKPVNYLDQSIYTGIQTRHIMAHYYTIIVTELRQCIYYISISVNSMMLRKTYFDQFWYFDSFKTST